MAQTFLTGRVVGVFRNEEKKEWSKVRIASMDPRESAKYRCIDAETDKPEILDQLEKLEGQIVQVEVSEHEKDGPRGKWSKFVVRSVRVQSQPLRAAANG